MDSIQEIIQTFSEEDVKKFGFFVNRSRQKTDRKDMDLFNILQEKQQRKPKEIITLMYGNSREKEAYHAVRKRLLKHLTDYIVLRNIEEEQTSTATIMRDVSLSQYLIASQNYALSLKYLLKAEMQAHETEQYDILNSIYNFKIEYYEQLGIENLEELVQTRNENQRLLNQDQNANIAYSLVKQKLKEFRLKGVEINFDAVTAEVLERFQLKETIYTKPKLMFKLASITRSAILAKKDYSSFEPFIIERYNLLKNLRKFNDKHPFYRLSFLYMIAHTLYRNKKFDLSQKYLTEMHEVMLTSKRSLFNEFYPKHLALYAANHVFEGKANEAAHLIEDLLHNPKTKVSNIQRLNFTINAGIYYFMANEFGKSHKMLLSINHTDKWCEKIMGREWVLKKNIMEVLLFFEMGKIEVVESRIRSIERNFSSLFEHPMYNRVKVFLALIKQVVINPDRIMSAQFMDKVDQSFEWLPQEQEDLQAMAFYAWLKSKMLNLPYYQVLQELVNG